MPTIVETKAIVKCDGKCNKEIFWIEQDIQKNPDALPSDAFRILILQDFKGNRLVFCSGGCLRQYLKGYTDPLSPREELAVAQANAEIEAKRKQELADREERRNGVTGIPFDASKKVPIINIKALSDTAFNQPDGVYATFDTTEEQVAAAENEGMIGD